VLYNYVQNASFVDSQNTFLSRFVLLVTLMELAAEWWLSPLSADHNDYLRTLELKLPSHTLRFPHHVHRRSLVDWLASICDKHRLCATAKHLGVSLMDFYMDRCDMEDSEEQPADLRLIALTALVLAGLWYIWLIAWQFLLLTYNVTRKQSA